MRRGGGGPTLPGGSAPGDAGPPLSDAGPATSDAGDGVTDGRPAAGDAAGGRYTREGLLGVGGMGRVYTARDAHLGRQVALKVAASSALAARLAAEARITAQLEHPGIVAVYDAGGGEGEAWYTMRLIRGRTLRDRIGAAPELAARLGLVPHLHAAAQAVAYAHAMGLVHRDLTPANIMVGEFGETQVADWGLARPTEAARADWARVVPVIDGGVSGTPRYMSPEQARGEAADPSTDVFALGVALHEILSGRAEAGPPDPDLLPPEAPRELAAVARRCLQAEPAARYPSAVELADDLGRWLSGRRVRAHEYQRVELLARFLRAWRAPLLVGAGALAVLGVVLAGAVQRMARERALAEANLALALTQQARGALAEHRLPEAYTLAAHALALGPSPEARGIVAAAGAAAARRVSRVELPPLCRHTGVVSPAGDAIACHGEGRIEIWGLDPLERRSAHEVPAADAPVWRGRAVLVATPERLLELDGEQVEELGPASAGVLAEGAAAFAVRGTAAWALAAAGPLPFETCPATRATTVVRGQELLLGCDDGQLRAYGPDGAPAWALDLGARPAWSVVSSDEAGLLVGGLDGTVRHLSLPGGAWSEPLQAGGGAIRAVVPVAGGELGVVLPERGGPRLWSLAANVWVGGLPSVGSRVAAGPAGEVLLVGEHLERWRAEPTPRPAVLTFEAGISQLALSPDGESVTVALGTGAVVERRLADGRERGRWQWGDQVVKSVAYGGAGLVAGAVGGPARRLLPGARVLPLEPAAIFRRAGRLHDGRVWASGYGATVHLVGVDGVVSSQTLAAPVTDGSSSADGRAVALLDARGRILLGDGGQWREVRRAPDARAVDVGDGGAPVAWALQRAVCLDDTCLDVGEEVLDLALAGERLAVGTVSGGVHVFDSRTGARLAVLPGHSGRVSSVELGPGGRWLASGSWDGTVRIWELDGLDTPPETLTARARERWGLELGDVLRAR